MVQTNFNRNLGPDEPFTAVILSLNLYHCPAALVVHSEMTGREEKRSDRLSPSFLESSFFVHTHAHAHNTHNTRTRHFLSVNQSSIMNLDQSLSSLSVPLNTQGAEIRFMSHMTGFVKTVPVIEGRNVDGSAFLGVMSKDLFSLNAPSPDAALHAHRAGSRLLFEHTGLALPLIKRPTRIDVTSAENKGAKLPAVFGRFVTAKRRVATQHCTRAPFHTPQSAMGFKGRNPTGIPLSMVPDALLVMQGMPHVTAAALDLCNALGDLAFDIFMINMLYEDTLSAHNKSHIDSFMAAVQRFEDSQALIPYALEVEA